MLIGSGARHGSGPNMATYSGAKAFEMRFAEGLWAELEPRGVDVLFFALAAPIRRHFGPIWHREVSLYRQVWRIPWMWRESDWSDFLSARQPAGVSAAQRRERVRMIAEMSADVFGKGKS